MGFSKCNVHLALMTPRPLAQPIFSNAGVGLPGRAERMASVAPLRPGGLGSVPMMVRAVCAGAGWLVVASLGMHARELSASASLFGLLGGRRREQSPTPRVEAQTSEHAAAQKMARWKVRRAHGHEQCAGFPFGASVRVAVLAGHLGTFKRRQRRRCHSGYGEFCTRLRSRA